MTAATWVCCSMISDSQTRRSEEHTSELQSHSDLVCRLLLAKKKHTSELQSHSDTLCRLLLDNTKPSPRRPRHPHQRPTQRPSHRSCRLTSCQLQRHQQSSHP